jgi:hypothetical protein
LTLGMDRQRSPFMLTAMVVSALLVLGLGAGWHLRENATPCSSIVESATDMVQDLAGVSGPVLGIAHNAAAGTKEVRRAMDCGAAVIEIDIIEADGQLRAPHDRPDASERIDAPLLQEIWPVAAEATMIKLDPKFPSSEFTELLIAFLDDRALSPETEVTVTTDDVHMLKTLRERPPGETFPDP